MRIRQAQERHETEASLNEGLLNVQSQLGLPPEDATASNLKAKKKKKKGPPPKEMIDFMRRKRSIMKQLKAKQRDERASLVETLNNLERFSS